MEQDNIIKAEPTKNLFITMLIRDLTLRDAIGDLVDNSVDGAKSFATDKENLEEFQIEIIANPEEFKIIDNCGGFSVNEARNYAFTFGRKNEQPKTPGSIGRFGIGMKRALFKLGGYFEVESITENSDFKMTVQVDDWAGNKDWNFSFESYNEHVVHERSECGTMVTVKNLREDVREVFQDATYLNKLKREIELEHLFSIHKGLKIKINNFLLKEIELDLLESSEIKPAYWNHTYQYPNEQTVQVKIYAGVSSDAGAQGGWYIFCNNRLVNGPDTSYVTGWTGRSGDGVAEYHDQFHRFRGYVFFEAEDSSLLPWNTTKTSMDMDSPLYREVRAKMIEVMRPIMSLMNTLKKEKEKDTEEKDRVLNNLISDLTPVRLKDIIEHEENLSSVFEYPKLEPQKKETSNRTRISYYVDKERFAEVKESLDLKTNKDIGKYTFDYYYAMEIS